MNAIDRFGCAVLAGGAGSRMGNINKAELRSGGVTFLSGICAEFEKAGLRGYISAAAYEQTVPEGWVCVRDCVADEAGGYIGPMGGIYSCLARAKEDGLEGLFFAPCDAPRFRSEAVEVLRKVVSKECHKGYDTVLLRTADGRLQTTFGWYSIGCIEAFREDIGAGRYKILKTLEGLSTYIADAAELGIEDDVFTNINRAEDYEGLKEARHIVISGMRGAGKTTLIDRIAEDAGMEVYGFRTVKEDRGQSDAPEVYIYPAAGKKAQRGPGRLAARTGGRVACVFTEAFDEYGASLIESAKPGGMIVMDEIGFIEKDAERFLKAVDDAFNGSIPVLAAVKEDEHGCEYLKRIKNHPKADLIMLTEENREEVFKEVRERVSLWNDGSFEEVKGDRHEEL